MSIGKMQSLPTITRGKKAEEEGGWEEDTIIAPIDIVGRDGHECH